MNINNLYDYLEDIHNGLIFGFYSLYKIKPPTYSAMYVFTMVNNI